MFRSNFEHEKTDLNKFKIIPKLAPSNCLRCFQNNRFELLFALAYFSSFYVMLLAEILHVT